MPSPGLTLVGFVWSLLSMMAAGAVCAGYYLPLWLINGNVSTGGASFFKAEFGCFRLCYPSENDSWKRISLQCGRYPSFEDIPTIWWKISTVTVGLGCALAILIAFVTLPAWCMSDVVSRASGRILGLFQLLSSLLICVGCVLYPLGWNNDLVKRACGYEAVGSYLIGTCTIGWAYYITLGGACGLFLCATLSTVAGRPVQWTRLMHDEDMVVHATSTGVSTFHRQRNSPTKSI